MRTFKPDVQDFVEQRLKQLCASVAEGFGATATVNYERIYPATINSPAEYTLATSVAEQLVGAENVVRNLEPSMGSEDFSFMLKEKPGAYLRLGQGEQFPDGQGGMVGGTGSRFLHNSCYDFNDSVLPLGAALFAGIVERSMPLA